MTGTGVPPLGAALITAGYVFGSMDLGLADSDVLVIAGSTGLGRACASAFAREDANVAVCGRNAQRLEAARESLNGEGTGSVLTVQADITDPDELEAVVEEVTADFGGLDHAVSSAGAPATKPFLDTTARDWYATYDLLVMSVVWLAERAHPFLAESEAGTLTAIASTDVREPVRGHVLSNAIRRSVPGLVKTLALEWAPDVRVNAVLPGPHATPSLEARLRDDVERGGHDSREAALDAVLDEVPSGRLGDPDALGDLVAVLASERAAFVTGTAFPIDGGTLRS